MQQPLHEQEPIEQTTAEEALTEKELRILAGFPTLSVQDLGALTESGQSHMNEDDLRFFRDYYRAERRLPSLGELRLFDRFAERRRSLSEMTFIGKVQAEDAAVTETYHDLLAKASVLLPDRRAPFGVAELAKVGGSYLRMVGRKAEEQTLTAPVRDTPCAELTLVSPAGEQLLCVGEAETETKADPFGEKGAAILLLLPSEEADVGYDEAVSSLCADREAKLLCGGTARIGRFGLLGALAHRCGGVLADLSRLPDCLPLSHLAEAYAGRLLLAAPRANTAYLSELAERYGLRAVYFAKVTDSGRFCTMADTAPALNWKLSFLRSLFGARLGRDCYIPKEAMMAACVHPPLTLRSKESGVWTLRAGQAWRAGSLTLSSAYGEIANNGFSVAVNTVVDALLGMVACGADRRCVGLCVSYSLPETQTEDGGLAAVLGVYRVMMETACPEQFSAVRNTAGVPSVSCTAFSPLRRRAIPSLAVCRDSRMVFLSVKRTADGLPDFALLRKLCDDVLALANGGRLLSARAVAGKLSEAINEMTAGNAFRPTERLSAYDGAFCQGILCQVVKDTELPAVGEILSVREDMEE